MSVFALFAIEIQSANRQTDFNDRFGDDDPAEIGTDGKLTAFPPGFRMVA